DLRHYRAALGKLKVGSGDYALNFPDWLDAFVALRILAQVFEQGIKDQVPDPDGEDALRGGIVIERETLACILSAATDLPVELMQTAVNVLTFDPRLKKRELYDFPLLPLSEGRVALSPHLVRAGDVVRAIENILAEWGDAPAAERGAWLEEDVSH